MGSATMAIVWLDGQMARSAQQMEASLMLPNPRPEADRK